MIKPRPIPLIGKKRPEALGMRAKALEGLAAPGLPPPTGPPAAPQGRTGMRAQALAQIGAGPKPPLLPQAAPRMQAFGGGGGGPQPPQLPAPPPRVQTTTRGQAIAAAAERAARGGGGTLVGGTGVAQVPQNQSDIDALAAERKMHTDEQAALKGELAAGRARDLQDIDARAGAGGFGLSGATSALRSDTSRQRDRTDALAVADLGRRQRDEGRADRREESVEKRVESEAEFVDLQRAIALRDLEGQADEDFDGDGFVGGTRANGGQKVGGTVGDGDVENNPAGSPEEERENSRAAKAEVLARLRGDGGDLSPYAGTVQDAEDLREQGITFDSTDARFEGPRGGPYYVVVRGSDGLLYKFLLDQEVGRAADALPSGNGYKRGQYALSVSGLS